MKTIVVKNKAFREKLLKAMKEKREYIKEIQVKIYRGMEK